MKAASLANFARRRGLMGLAVVLVVGAAALCWWLGLFEREPSYQGQTAADWLESIQNGGSWSAATAAFRAMGPKGVRFLARTLEKKPFLLPQSVEQLIDKLHLPEWADPTRRIGYNAAHLSYRQEAARGILGGFGSDAPALPILVRMFRHGDGEEVEGSAELMAPMADKLEFMVPELIEYLDQNKPDDLRTFSDIRLLSAIGPKAKDATPVLLKIAQAGYPSTAPQAAVALWNIARETNELIRTFSICLQSHGDSVDFVLFEVEKAVPLPKPLAPLLEQALRHPQPSVRRAAESLLYRIDPGRLRQIEDELNRRQEQILQDHLKLLQSSNVLDRINAERALQFFGPMAVAAAPRLVEIMGLPMNGANDKLSASRALKSLGSNASMVTPALVELLRSNQFAASEICEILGEIGPGAAEAIPTLQALLATNHVMVPNQYRGGSFGSPQAFHEEIVPRLQVAQALALIDPHQSNAIAILREAQATNRRPVRGVNFAGIMGGETRIPATITLWKLGLETNLPLDELIARGDGWAFDTLADIGPAAKKALPMIEKQLKNKPLRIDAALAIPKIDPEEAKRLGLPGLFIICPDKY